MKKGPGIPTWLQWAWYLATFIDTKGKQNQKNLLSVQFPPYTVLIEYTRQLEILVITVTLGE